jgi:hypothetical protein
MPVDVSCIRQGASKSRESTYAIAPTQHTRIADVTHSPVDAKLQLVLRYRSQAVKLIPAGTSRSHMMKVNTRAAFEI